MSPKATGLLVGARTTAGASVSVQARTGAGVAAGAPVTGTANSVGDVFVTVGGLTAGGVYYADVVVVSAGTPISPVTVTGKVTVGAGNGAGDFVPVGPIRSYDYRDTGAGGPWASGATRTVRVSGVAGVPTSGVSAVAVAISVVAPTAAGFITVWPSTSTKPLSTAVNFVAGQTKTNLVKVPVDSSGTMSIYNFTGTTGITVDVVGYYIDDTTTFTHAVSFQAVTPVRALDTRPLNGATNRRLTGGNTITTTVTGTTLNVPTTATAVEIQVEAIDPAAAGYLTVWATGTPQPIVSNVLYGNHQTIVTSAIAPIGTNGQITIYSNVTTDIAIDIAGYYDPTAGGKFHAINTTRLYDTRQPSLTKLNQDENRTIPLATGTPIPTNATAVVFAATAVNNTSPSYLTFWPGNQCKPLAAMLLPNAPNQLTDNLIVTGLGNQTTGAYNFLGQTDLVIDANGYYTGGTPAPPCTASVVGKATISNTTTPAPGVTVTAYRADDTPAGSTTTSATGTYTLTLPAGTYRICFDGTTATTPTTGLISQCYGGAPWGHALKPARSATLVPVTSPAMSLLPTILHPGGSFTGRVTADANAVGLAGVTVIVAYALNADGRINLTAAGDNPAWEAGRFVTAADGTYTAKGIDAHLTGVCFDGSTATNGPAPGAYLPECSDNVPLLPDGAGALATDARTFALSPTTTLTVNAGLWSGASIAGRVTNTAGQGLAGVIVTAGGPFDRWSATTGPDGTYLIKGLAAGRYPVCFDATGSTTGSATGYLSECYTDVAWDPSQERPTATPVVVATSPVTAINAALLSGGGIAGVVTSTTGVPVAGVRVTLRNSAGVTRDAITSADGSYRTVGLPGTAYTVCLDTAQASAMGFTGTFEPTCRVGVPYSPRTPRADAALTPVTLGAISSADAQLTPLGVITGRLALPATTRTTSLTVGAYRADGQAAVTTWIGQGTGSFLLSDNLALPGTYYLCARDATGVYAGECYPNVPWDGGAIPVGAAPLPLTTAAARATVDIDLAFAPTGPVVGITGTVTDHTGAPLAGVSVQAYSGDRQRASSTTTAANGSYWLGDGLAPGGAYYVCFGSVSDSTRMPTCHANVPWEGVDPIPSGLPAVTIPAAGSTAKVNAVLRPRPTITGRVTAKSTGAALGGVTVTAYGLADGSVRATNLTRADGTYALPVIAGTSYRVCFAVASESLTTSGTATGYAPACHAGQPFDGQTVPAASSPVAAGSSGINAALIAGAAIAGRVSDAAGQAIPNTRVSLVSATGRVVGAVQTAWDGQYRISGLATLPVAVCFEPPDAGASPTGYRPECHDDVGLPTATFPAPGSTTVTPPAGATVTVDSTLAAGGAITGRVSDPSGGALTSVSVEVRDLATNQPARSTKTGSDGRYAVRNLPSGSYSVCFRGGLGASGAGYFAECFDDVVDQATPTPITVALGATSTADATLTPASRISGKITGPDGIPVRNARVDVYTAAGAHVAASGSSSDGFWTASRLLAGTYLVCVDASSAQGLADTYPYLSECYQDVAWDGSSAPPASTTGVTVTAGAVRTGIDSVLAEKPAIVGRVTSSAGAPLANVRVVATPSGDPTAGWTETRTSSTGEYAVPVTAGSFVVCFDGSRATGGSSATGYLSECHDDVPAVKATDQPVPAGVTPVAVPATGRVTVNATLASAGGFTGTASSASPGYLVGPVSLQVLQAQTREPIGSGGWSTSSYALGGLPTGSYALCFQADGVNGLPIGGYAQTCVENRQTTAGAPAAVVNPTLTPQGQIAGTVTDFAGQPLYPVFVHVFGSDGRDRGGVSTDPDGRYSVNVPLGAYTVCFVATATGRHQSECYRDVAWATPTPWLAGPPAGTTPVWVDSYSWPTTVDVSLASLG